MTDKSSITTAVPKCRVTASRPPAVKTSELIHQPNVARGNATVSAENASGDEAYSKQYQEYVREGSPPLLNQS